MRSGISIATEKLTSPLRILRDNTVTVLLGNGDGTFQTKVPYTVGTGPLDIKSADVNGDGVPDLAVVNNSGQSISVLLGTNSL